MTSHYFDLYLQSDPELAPHQLMSSLITRLHRALVQQRRQDIGVSFPAHDEREPRIGSHLRLHGPESSLDSLMGSAWLRGVQDYLRIEGFAIAPQDARYRLVSRVQAKSSPARLRRRAVRRHKISAEAAHERIPDCVAERINLPFVMIGSRSTGQASFPLFIRHGDLLPHPTPGSFSSYGLSRTATIPWF